MMVALSDISNPFTSELSGKLKSKIHVLGDKIQSLNQKHVSKSHWHSKKGIPSGAVINTVNSDNRNTITAAYNFSESVVPDSNEASASSSYFKQTSSNKDKIKDRQIRPHAKRILNSSAEKKENCLDMMLLSPSCAKKGKREVQKGEHSQVVQAPSLPQESTSTPKENDNSKANLFFLDQHSSTSEDAFSLSLSSVPVGFCMVLDEHITV